jgi:hypothetical protein
MMGHIRGQALDRYGIQLHCSDVFDIAVQCRSQRGLHSVQVNHPKGRTEKHIVIIRGVRMLAVFRNGLVVTVMPREDLPLDGETAIAAAFRRAMAQGVEA